MPYEILNYLSCLRLKKKLSSSLHNRIMQNFTIVCSMSVLKLCFWSSGRHCVGVAIGKIRDTLRLALFENPRLVGLGDRNKCTINETSRLFAKAVEISWSHEKFTRPKSLEVPFPTPMSVSHTATDRGSFKSSFSRGWTMPSSKTLNGLVNGE